MVEKIIIIIKWTKSRSRSPRRFLISIQSTYEPYFYFSTNLSTCLVVTRKTVEKKCAQYCLARLVQQPVYAAPHRAEVVVFLTECVYIYTLNASLGFFRRSARIYRHEYKGGGDYSAHVLRG